MIKKTSFYYYVFITALSMMCCCADDIVPLVGSLHSIREEVASASDVVIGKFTKIKAGGAASMMGLEYHGQITVLKTLKGNAVGNFEVGFSVILGGKNKEAEPNLDETYIIVLADHQDVRKLLPATEDNLAKIKALIAATPVGK